jgi:hypothetical protein
LFVVRGLVIGLAAIVPAAELAAAEWSVESNASLTGEVDDNIRLDDNNKQSDYGAIFTPQLGIRGISPVWDLNFGLELSIARYAQDSTLNSEDSKFFFDTLYRGQRSEFSVEGEASRTSTRVTEETDSGNFSSTTERDLFQIFPTWSHHLTDRDTLTVGAGWTEVDFGSNDFTGYRTLTGNAGWAREVTVTDVMSLTFFTDYNTEFETATDLDSEEYGVLVGWDRTFSEKLTTSLAAGPQYYTTEVLAPENGGTQTVEKDELGYRLSASVDYLATELTTLGAGFSHEIEPSSGGSPLQRNSFEANARHQFLPRLSGTLRTFFQMVEDPTEDDTGSDDRNYISVEPELTYQLAMDWDVSARYRFRSQESGNSDRAYSNAIFATITYRPVR